MDFSRIIEHPLSEEIVDKLVHGVKPKDVSDWLKLKFPEKDQSHLRLPAKLLKDFADSSLDLYETLRQDIHKAKTDENMERKVTSALRNNKTYQERMVEIADEEIDIKKIVQEVAFMIRERAIQVFDKIQENPSNTKPDHVLIKWFEVLLNSLEKVDKIVHNSPDQIIQHNVTVQVMDQYMDVLQGAVRETLEELDSETAFIFMDKLNQKMDNLELPEELKPKKSLSQTERKKQTEILTGKIESFKDE